MKMEAAPGKIGEVVTTHRNTEGELVTIERCRGGEFAGQLVLCIYDDETSTVAPTLLDEGTQRWLLAALDPVSVVR